MKYMHSNLKIKSNFMFIAGGTEGTTTDFPFVTEIDPTPSLGLVTDSVDEETATTPPIITRTVPAGEDLDLTCEIPDGTEFLSWSLVQSDSVIPLIEGALDNMAVSLATGLYSSLCHNS